MKNIIAAIIVALGLAVGGIGMAQADDQPTDSRTLYIPQPHYPPGGNVWMNTPCEYTYSRDCYWDPAEHNGAGVAHYNIRINRQNGKWCRVYWDYIYGAFYNYCGQDGNLQPANR
jgi:hypothetical protein